MKKQQQRVRARQAAAEPPSATEPVPEETSSAAFRCGMASLLLVALVLAVFLQTGWHGYFMVDDDHIIYANPDITCGLSLTGLEADLTHFAVARWEPLSMLCGQINCQLFGLWPGGHHLSNVVLYAGAVVALFFAFYQLTGNYGGSLALAAVYAMHPLHVETVAWATQRAYLLCSAFVALTLFYYAKYARSPANSKYYLGAIGFYLMSLMSKGIAVPLPIALFLFDWWPLGRLKRQRDLWPLVVEKIPFFALTAMAVALNLWANRNPLEPWLALPFPARLENTLLAYATYMKEFFLPLHLGSYSFAEDGPPPWKALLSAAVFIGASVLAWYYRKNKPWLLVGWAWYVIMLLPTVGFFSTPGQYFGNRYPFFSLAGLALAVIWTLLDWSAAWPALWRDRILPAAGAVVVAALAVISFNLTSYWSDNAKYWKYCLACHPDNAVAHVNLGELLAQKGDFPGAIEQYRLAIQSNPKYSDAHFVLALSLLQQKKVAEAVKELQETVQLRPERANSHIFLGSIYMQTGHQADGLTQLRAALATDPTDPELVNQLVDLLRHLGVKTAVQAKLLLGAPVTAEDLSM